MPDIVTDWLYTDSFPTKRQTTLAAPSTFGELVELATAEISKVRVRVDPGRDPGLTDCLQPVFSFELPTVGDRTFQWTLWLPRSVLARTIGRAEGECAPYRRAGTEVARYHRSKSGIELFEDRRLRVTPRAFRQILDPGDSISAGEPNRRLKGRALACRSTAWCPACPMGSVSAGGHEI